MEPHRTEIYFRGTEKFLIRAMAVGMAIIVTLLVILIFVEANRPIEVYINEDQAKHLLFGE